MTPSTEGRNAPWEPMLSQIGRTRVGSFGTTAKHLFQEQENLSEKPFGRSVRWMPGFAVGVGSALAMSLRSSRRDGDTPLPKHGGSGLQDLVCRLFQLEHPTTLVDPQVEEWIQVTATCRLGHLLEAGRVRKTVTIGLEVGM